MGSGGVAREGSAANACESVGSVAESDAHDEGDSGADRKRCERRARIASEANEDRDEAEPARGATSGEPQKAANRQKGKLNPKQRDEHEG
jgi:hypothetical protein